MKSSAILLAFAAAERAFAASAGYACPRDECLNAVLAYKGDSKGDCNAYFATTVTPKAKTVKSTKTVYTTPTQKCCSTKTKIESVTATNVVSVVETDTVSVAATALITQTATVTTVDKTVTVTKGATTTTAGSGGKYPLPGHYHKERDNSGAHTIPSYAGCCSDDTSYQTACSCIGASTTSTVYAPAPTVTNTVTTTLAAPTKTVTTVCATVTSTNTVATVPVTQTVGSTTVTQVTGTVTSVSTVTSVVHTTATAIATPRHGHLGCPGGKGGSGISYLNFDVGFSFDLNIFNIFNFDLCLEFDADIGIGASSIFEVGVDGSVVLRSGPFAGQGAFCSSITSQFGLFNSLNSFSAFLSGASSLNCRVSDNNEFLCKWAATEIDAEWWLCGGGLALVQPGCDATKSCAKLGSVQAGVSVFFYDA